MQYEEKIHPTVGVLIRSNGEVFVPATRYTKAHWTFGSKYRNGYLVVQINGKRYLVHRLVLEAFVGPCPVGFECDHKDRNRSNNHIENLRWASSSENSRNTLQNDRIDARGGTHWYENRKQYRKEESRRRCKTHKNVLFSDGKQRFIPNSEAILLLAIPVKERIYIKQ